MELKNFKKASNAEPPEAEKYKKKARDFFDKAYKLYSLFWGINLNLVKVDEVGQVGQRKKEVHFISEKSEQNGKATVFDKLGELVKKVIDCCKE